MKKMMIPTKHRPTTMISLRIPVDVLEKLKKIAPGQRYVRISGPHKLTPLGSYLHRLVRALCQVTDSRCLLATSVASPISERDSELFV